MLVKLGSFRQIRFQNVVSGQIAAIESIEEISEPGVGSCSKGLKNRMQQEFTEIINGVRD